MTHRNIKIGVTVLVIALAFAGMVWSTLRDGTEYYKNLDEVMTDPAQWHGKVLQLHGYVVPDSIMRSRTNGLEYRFRVQNNPAKGGAAESGPTINVSYTGVVPDTFKGEAEVVLRGQLTSDDAFKVVPNGVTAKCPSKYDPATAGKSGA